MIEEFFDECTCEKFGCDKVICDGSCGCTACWLALTDEGCDHD